MFTDKWYRIVEVLWSLQNRPQIPKRYNINPFLRFSGTFRLRKGNFYLFSRFLSPLLPLSNTDLTLHLQPPHGRVWPWRYCPLGSDAGNFQLFLLFSAVAACSSPSNFLFPLLWKDDNLSNHLRPRDGSHGVFPSWVLGWLLEAATYSFLFHLSQCILETLTFCHFLLHQLLSCSLDSK